MLCNIMLHFCHSLYYNNKLKFSPSEFLSSPYFIHDTSCIIDLTSTGCPWVPTSLQLKSLMTLTCQYSILQCIRSCHFIIIVTSATLKTLSSLALFKPRLVLPFWYLLIQVSWQRGHYTGVVVVVVVVVFTWVFWVVTGPSRNVTFGKNWFTQYMHFCILT